MTEESNAAPEVPRQVFEKFLDELQQADLPEKTVERLRKVLLEQPDFTEAAIAAALAPDSDDL